MGFHDSLPRSLAMSATHTTNSTPSCAPVLYLALDLGASSWKLAFSVGLGQKPRLKTIAARSTLGLIFEIKAAKGRFGLPEDAPVVCCFEAGRDGFWLHRFLLDQGVQNQVVDSSSIEGNRRRRRAKSDSLDAAKLVEMLIRLHNGERKVWSTVHVPTVEQEDQRSRRAGTPGDAQAQGRADRAGQQHQGALGWFGVVRDRR